MRITVKTKLGLAFALVIVLSAMTAWLGINNLASLNATLDRVVQGPAQRVILSQELSEQLLMIVRAEKNLNLSDTKEETASFDTELAAAGVRRAPRSVRSHRQRGGQAALGGSTRLLAAIFGGAGQDRRRGSP
jgi:hypothetical protein